MVALTLKEADQLAATMFENAFCAVATVDGTCEILQGDICGEAKIIGCGSTFAEAFDAAVAHHLEQQKFLSQRQGSDTLAPSGETGD